MPVTSEIARIDDELRRAYNGDSWHGPSIRQVLEGVTWQQAAKKHPLLTHSIWALVNHLVAWVEVVTLRITEKQAVVTPRAGDFPAVTDTSEQAWEKTLSALEREHDKLLDVVAGLAPARLEEIVPGKDYPVAVMLHGAAQHHAYHAGQIALLKKL